MDRYERERFVGRGACGTAFVCRRKIDDKRVVIKEIGIEMNDADRETTLNEIKVAYQNLFLCAISLLGRFL